MTDEKLTERHGPITGMPRAIRIWFKVAGILVAGLIILGLFQIFVN